MVTSTLLQTTRCRADGARGFTLVELMITVSIIAVLATLAMVSYKKYVDGARISEPVATLQAIRTAEEQVKREVGHYLDVSTSNTYYPMNSGFGTQRVAWDSPLAQAHADYARWKQLEVVAEGPMRFGYKANAGVGGTAVTTTVAFKTGPTLPKTSANDWYVLQAMGDPDNNGVPTRLLSVSFTSVTQSVLIEENVP